MSVRTALAFIRQSRVGRRRLFHRGSIGFVYLSVFIAAGCGGTGGLFSSGDGAEDVRPLNDDETREALSVYLPWTHLRDGLEAAIDGERSLTELSPEAKDIAAELRRSCLIRTTPFDGRVRLATIGSGPGAAEACPILFRRRVTSTFESQNGRTIGVGRFEFYYQARTLRALALAPIRRLFYRGPWASWTEANKSPYPAHVLHRRQERFAGEMETLSFGSVPIAIDQDSQTRFHGAKAEGTQTWTRTARLPKFQVEWKSEHFFNDFKPRWERHSFNGQEIAPPDSAALRQLLMPN
jgi:hypothetical protein